MRDAPIRPLTHLLITRLLACLLAYSLTHLPQGEAEVEREGKHIYRGAVVDGEYEGYGECTYTDGASYAGSWRAGKWHGRGKLTMADGGTYEGGFEEGERHGKGVLLAAAAIVAVGALDVETGVYTIGVAGTPGLEDGAAVAEYDGGWARGAMAGAGRLALRSGETYEGHF